MPDPSVHLHQEDRILTVAISRPEVRNAVDSATAAALAEAFKNFESDDALCAAVLTGAGGTFCAPEPICANWPMDAEPLLKNMAQGRWGPRGCS
jgi:enoyl-CoA hydratase